MYVTKYQRFKPNIAQASGKMEQECSNAAETAAFAVVALFLVAPQA